MKYFLTLTVQNCEVMCYELKFVELSGKHIYSEGNLERCRPHHPRNSFP
jgi:hypothetical protein